MALVSIILPCYNAAPFLQETLESAYAQTHADVEILAVNDGSTDATAAILDAQGDRIRVFHGPNRGAAEARNLGTTEARGEYLLYLDADDLLLPDTVARSVAALTGSSADVAYTDWEFLREGPEGVFEIQGAPSRTIESAHVDPALAVLTDFWCPPAALLYRRRIVDRIGGWRQDLAPIEDARFLMDAALQGGQFVHIPNVGVRYRIPIAPSHSRRSKLRFVQSVFRSAFEVEQTWRQNGNLGDSHRNALARVYGYCARGLFREDPATFRACAQALKGLGLPRGADWTRVASMLEILVGHRAALAVLRGLGRRAP